MLLKIVLMLFVLIELSNVLILYFKPESKMGNGLGVFNAFTKSKNDAEVHSLIIYLINWVAGTKLIFIALIITIVFFGSRLTQFIATGAMILSISSFFWRLYPMIKDMDLKNSISPKGYSKTLKNMIAVFILVFTVALVFSLFIPTL